jgi:pyridoxine 4-dehydrogenase
MFTHYLSRLPTASVTGITAVPAGSFPVSIVRKGPERPLGLPEYLRQQVELSLRFLKLDRIPLYQLHRVDERVPLSGQVGELSALQREGKIEHIGLSEL